ncbi:hypothetical protein GIB67_022958 [Kingdonia uniflora]|uniref:ATP-dependent DNA helicase n=1 Tax=Kingdonia uniflora TaxID=39325 RepID=A0A7J7P2C3_9MAGN|nr:hypothetical protein GIB67_022958 [Kingdonia uniflora]
MKHNHCIEVVKCTMRDMLDDPRSFGGITVVLGGYFCKILPVVPKGAHEQVVAASLRRLSSWRHVRILSLNENIRLHYVNPHNTRFADYLMEIGSNPQKTIKLPSIIHNCTSVQNLILSLYSNLNISCDRDQDFLTERTILSVRNDNVSSINDDALNMFPGEPIVYLATDKISEDEISLTLLTTKMPFEMM